MKDCFGCPIEIGDWVVHVTVNGHKPILTKSRVFEAEEARIRVAPAVRSITGWRVPDGMKPVWLHQPENIVIVRQMEWA